MEEAHKAGKHLATHGIYHQEIHAAFDAGFDKRDTFEHTGLLANSPEYQPELLRAIVQHVLALPRRHLEIEAPLT